MTDIYYWKSVAILLAISFLIASVPRFSMIVKLGVRRRPEEDNDRMLDWFWFSNAGVMIGLVISVIVLVSAAVSW